MISTPERIQLLAEACALPCVAKWLGAVTAGDLQEWLAAELGSAAALDDFQPHGRIRSKAVAPTHILHILSGNTPHAAFQSLVRALVLGSHSTFKIPSGGLADFTDCLPQFPPALADKIEITPSISDEQWHRYEAVIAIGSDESVAALHEKSLPGQIFIAHGHKISIGMVEDDFEQAARLAARDVSLHNQRGCLSPHAIYVKGEARVFAGFLAREMDAFASQHPPEAMSLSEAGAVRNLRETTRFRSANDASTEIWESDGSLDWTVIFESTPTLKLSCLNRCVYVKPLPLPMDCTGFGPEAQHLSTIAIHPFSESLAASLSALPAHRICPLGMSQQPSLFWHHDGFAPLASLVKWTDLG